MTFDAERFMKNFEQGTGVCCLPRAIHVASKSIGAPGLSPETIVEDLKGLKRGEGSAGSRIIQMLRAEGVEPVPRLVDYQKPNWTKVLREARRNGRAAMVYLPPDEQQSNSAHTVAVAHIFNDGVRTFEGARFGPDGERRISCDSDSSGFYDSERLENTGAFLVTFRVKPRE